MITYERDNNSFHSMIGMGENGNGVEKEEDLEKFIYEIKWLGKVVSVHSIRSLLVFDNNTIQKSNLLF